jgi:hypothetical protein
VRLLELEHAPLTIHNLGTLPAAFFLFGGVSSVMDARKVATLVHAYDEALGRYRQALRAVRARGLPRAAETQRLDDARVLLEVARRAYFDAR